MPDKRVTEWIKSKCHFLKLNPVNTAWGNIFFFAWITATGVRQYAAFRPGSHLETLTAVLPSMMGITGQLFLTINLQSPKEEAYMRSTNSTWQSCSPINRTTDNGPKQLPSLSLASRLHLDLMDTSLCWQLLKVPQMQCFVWAHRTSFLI